MTLQSPFRWLLVVALGLGLQLCCCRFHSLCDAQTLDNSSSSSSLPPCHKAPAKPAPAESQHHSDHGPCSCGADDLARIAPDAPRFELPTPTLLAFLPLTHNLPTLKPQAALPSAARGPASHPPTSLLDQRCALIV